MDTKNKQGYWTEGKNVNGTNIGGGVYVNGVNPSSATTNVAGSTAIQPMTQPPLEVPSVFDSTRLGEKPINLPQPLQNNAANTALSASTGAFVNNVTSNPTNPSVPVTPTPQQENVSAIQNLISKLSNKGTRTQEVNTQMGIDQKKAKALSYEQQAMATSRAYDNQIKAIQEKNTEGQFGSAVQGEIARITRQKNSDLADLAILQKVAIDDYNSAVDIAQKKIDAEFEPIQTELQNRQNLFNMLQNNMTEKEKLDYQNQLAIDKQSAEDFRKAKSDYSAIAIQNGNAQAATAITNAKTQEEVSRIAATYGLTSIDDQYKKAQINKLNFEMSGNKSTAPKIEKINGVDMQWDSAQKKWIPASAEAVKSNTMSLAQAKSSVDLITNLSNNIVSSTVGTSLLSRSQPGLFRNLGKAATIVGLPQAVVGAYQRLSGQQQEFIAGVEQLRSNLNLDTLINAKSRGATFGALSDNELAVLANAATKIGIWTVKNDAGQVVGYNTTQENLQKELDKINNFAKLDYIIRGGDPSDVDAQLQSDGTIWVKNRDGKTLTQIK